MQMLLLCVLSFMKQLFRHICFLFCLLFFADGTVYGQMNTVPSEKLKKASRKVEAGFKKEQPDTLAQGFFDLAETYRVSGDLGKSEYYFSRAKEMFERLNDAEGIARSSRALAKVQEDLNKDKEAAVNYQRSISTNASPARNSISRLSENDMRRLAAADSIPRQEALIQQNIKLGIIEKDTGEIIAGFSRMAAIGEKNQNAELTVDAYRNAFQYAKSVPEQALQFNQKLAEVYAKSNELDKAIEAKRELLAEPFVQQSSKLKAREMVNLADYYLMDRRDSAAFSLLREAYALAVQDGHTMEARLVVEKMDSLFSVANRTDMRLHMYRDFLEKLPGLLSKDSSIADNRLVAETESRIRELENENALRDDLIRRKNVFNSWLIVFVVVLTVLLLTILVILRKLRKRNKRIALQSLRREMNPHFIFNSLNSVNQFIASNNEIEANRYLSRFSTLMRRVMENSTNDFVLFAREYELLHHYLELEKTRFPDKVDYEISLDESMLADEHLFIPCMLIQPFLENAIWHGLRYADKKGLIRLSFRREKDSLEVEIDDNGIGLAASKRAKTEDQKKRQGRGMLNTMERVSILNDLYRRKISCRVTDKQAPETGVRVHLSLPVINKHV